MNYPIIIPVFLLLFLAGCDNPVPINGNNSVPFASSKIINYNTLTDMDTTKFNDAQAVIKARLIHEGVGDKFIWDTVMVLQVLKNETSYKFPKELLVAHYSWEEGIKSDTECILYLVPYPLGALKLNNKNEWILLGGKAATGISYN